MIPVTADDLERMAFDSGAMIEMRRDRAFLTVGRLTYGAVLEPATCAHPLWQTALLCDRERDHQGGHTYHASDCPDGVHDDGPVDQ